MGVRPLSVPIARANLNQEDVSTVIETLESGWLVQGPKVQDFESKWSDFTGAEHSVAVTSCTTAMQVSLASLGIGPGDEVIVPAFTWISTANVVEHMGASVVFCDVNLRTFNIDLDDAKSKITPNTKAILPVHLFGLPADMDGVMGLSRSQGLLVVEDAACGFGSTFRGQHVGTFGNAGAFSFHPRKAITTGEGGMITTNDSDLAVRLKRLRDHGAEISDLQRHRGPKPFLLPEFPDAGYNYRMTDIQGALGSSQMNRASGIVGERRRLASIYDEALRDLEWLETPFNSSDFGHSYQSYACIFKPDLVRQALAERNVQLLLSINQERDTWMETLQQAGVSTRPATHAVHMLEYYQKKYAHKPSDFFGAYAAYMCSVSLPLFHGMTDEEQAHVIAAVRNS